MPESGRLLRRFLLLTVLALLAWIGWPSLQPGLQSLTSFVRTQLAAIRQSLPPEHSARQSDSRADARRIIRHPSVPTQARTFLEDAGHEPSPCPEIVSAARKAMATAISRDSLDLLLLDLSRCKWRRKSYQTLEIGRHSWLLGAIPALPWPEEHLIRQAILKLAASRPGPSKKSIREIPFTESAVTLDGNIDQDEWRHALILGAPSAANRILLQTDGKMLFIAADVPEDTTPKRAMNEMQVIWHQTLSPLLKNVYLFVYGDGRASGVFRSLDQQKIQLPGLPPHAGVAYDHAAMAAPKAAVSMNGHRRYELALPIDKATLPRGAPFPLAIVLELAARFEIDDKTHKKRFASRRYARGFAPRYDAWVMPRAKKVGACVR